MWKRIGTRAGTTGAVILAMLANACGGSTMPSGNGTDAGGSSSGGQQDSGTTFECSSTADCPSTAPICCGTIRLAGCELVEVSSVCATTCAVSAYPQSCPPVETAEFCGYTPVASYCTDPSYPKCCAYGVAAQPFCVSAANVAALERDGATCL